jgi:hypothetical protein
MNVLTTDFQIVDIFNHVNEYINYNLIFACSSMYLV